MVRKIIEMMGEKRIKSNFSFGIKADNDTMGKIIRKKWLECSIY